MPRERWQPSRVICDLSRRGYATSKFLLLLAERHRQEGLRYLELLLAAHVDLRLFAIGHHDRRGSLSSNHVLSSTPGDWPV